MAILKVLEILSESPTSWEDAAKKGIEKTSESVRNIRSAHVQHQSMTVKDGKVQAFRVNVRITFEVED